jgi:hypothetical protein
MLKLSALPLRQKIFISLIVLSGLSLIILYNAEIISIEKIRLSLFFYGMGIPFLLLIDEFLVDLNNNEIFKFWIVISIFFVLCYFLLRNNSALIIHRSPKFVNAGFNKLIAANASSTFKALPLFLLCYWFLNKILKKKTGKFIVSTFRKYKWYSEEGEREINGTDVLINILLLIVIIGASLIDA